MKVLVAVEKLEQLLKELLKEDVDILDAQYDDYYKGVEFIYEPSRRK